MNAESEVKSNDLNFYGSDPGAVKFGNFINYYSFHDVSERIQNLHPQMFPEPVNNQIVCLDIGCNTGDLSKAIYIYLKTIYPNCDIHMLAVDIDSMLIERAKEANDNPHIKFITCNIMEQNDRQLIQSYLDSCNQRTFDLSFCFSVTMWIHLNNGDAGLLDFLKYLKLISRTIVIEPQPWKCYRNAQRRVKKSGNNFDLYESLKIKSDVDMVIEKTLSEDTHIKTYESQFSSWNRRVQSFHRLSTPVNN
ncbi:RNA 5'-monophosphate methyltransferase-like [Spodoptera frugiperda]|uniref:RNA methyltransferase n=1 Tax=Spodoptera frugiperda TaxID=7108 RepID=A0A9R0DA17_SPOFR|nr:RNA 5'-monophosphate methyltransferase-like [Spodoptera frugiperda]